MPLEQGDLNQLFAADFPKCQLSGLRWANSYSSHKSSAAMEFSSHFCDCSTKAEIINTKVLHNQNFL